MVIKKILSNNIVLALDARGRESVLLGKGIAFGKKAGEVIDIATVERVFSPKEKGLAEKLSHIIEKIPMEHVRVCDEIIHMAKSELQNPLSDNIYLSLIDHISFAIRRFEGGVNLVCSLKWEMRRFYPHEFAIGRRAIGIIQKRLGIRLHQDEAAFIAFHLVNAGVGSDGNSQRILLMVRDISAIVKRCHKGEFDEDGLHFNRLLQHIKYVAIRVLGQSKDALPSNPSGDLLNKVLQEYTGEMDCVDEIDDYLKKMHAYTLHEEEKAYLLIHLHSLLTR